ncbi:radical SAM additional 4Fe4S-binding SPASM domain-containing protein [Lachnospiraceae bacterium M18-1]|nr:radical SAM additional 4Fe4S-binding SPASM domain-containing protein [Lachnospiraceae bacterium M18-1]
MSIKEEVVKNSSRQVIRYAFTAMDDILAAHHGEKWKQYRKRWTDTQNINELSNIPLYLLLELNSFCNLRCKMCKHADDNQSMERESMSIEVFDKIIRECRDLDIPSINIGTGTECTLHPKFNEIVEKVKYSGAIDKFFLTNGTTLSENMINRIFTGEYERVEISVDAATRETYEKIRVNGNYEKLEKMILKLIDEKKKRRMNLPIIRLSFCVQNDNIDEIDMFYNKWENKVDLIEYQKVSSYPSADQILEPKVTKCLQPFNRMTINYRGDIFACCSILYQDRFCLGNIRDMSIYEAWHSEKMNKLRNSFINGNLIQHCRECLVSVYGGVN